MKIDPGHNPPRVPASEGHYTLALPAVCARSTRPPSKMERLAGGR